MSRPRAYYQLISFGAALYAIGGHDGGELNTMERYSKQAGWEPMTNLPYANHRLS